VDTLTALVRAAKRETDVFRGQYEEINRLRQICAGTGICCLLIHHTRKGLSDGPVEAVAGTGGITAALDAIWHLRRKHAGNATLDVVGRELEERSFALHFKREEPFGWQFVGNAPEVALSAQREEILELLRCDSALTPAQIALALNKNANTVRSLIQRLYKTGHLTRDSDGGYLTAGCNGSAILPHSST
jgi:DNA-binding CsgD family transcriptional regulator